MRQAVLLERKHEGSEVPTVTVTVIQTQTPQSSRISRHWTCGMTKNMKKK
jgi:hypothetical protein